MGGLNIIKSHKCDVMIIVFLVLLPCFTHSEASSCKGQPIRCPFVFRKMCYCPDGSRAKLKCQNGSLVPQKCVYTPTTTLAPEKTCKVLPAVVFAEMNYSRRKQSNGYPLGTTVKYSCKPNLNQNIPIRRVCKEDGWDNAEPVCSCAKQQPHDKLRIIYGEDDQNDHYPIGTIARYYCVLGSNSGLNIGERACTRYSTSFVEWEGSVPNSHKCDLLIPSSTTHMPTTTVKTTITTDTDSSLQHNEGRMLVIVSGTTGAILGALIILVVIVSCQRRLHYHRMRRARLRHRQDQDAFTAFIAYHRDVRLMLPSYDEAINQQEHGQPPTFEEAVGHYEEPSLSPDHTLAGENSPASSLEDAPTPSSTSGSSTSGSSTHSSVENGSDTFPLVTSPDGQSPPENNRLIRSIRMLFGGRAFRTDAIYCRFVPQEDENEANQNESQAASDSTEDTDLNVVLARAGLC